MMKHKVVKKMTMDTIKAMWSGNHEAEQDRKEPMPMVFKKRKKVINELNKT